MPSSEFSELQAAATEAETFLAHQRGMADDKAFNLLYAEKNYLGVFGSPQVVSIPQPGGGYRRRTFLQLTVTRDQDRFNPVEKTKITRLVPTPLEYIINTIDTHDPIHWVLTLVKFGEN